MKLLVAFSSPLLILLLSNGKVSAYDEEPLGTIRGATKRDLDVNDIFGGTDGRQCFPSLSFQCNSWYYGKHPFLTLSLLSLPSIASFGEFPSFVSLGALALGSCGGTLISPTRVLTAAHCFFDKQRVFSQTYPDVRIGHTNINNGEVVEVECVQIHPNYTATPSNDLFNDVAIIKLKTAATTTNFATINSNTNYPPAGTSLTTIGFGYNNAAETTNPTTLQKYTEPSVSLDQCGSAECINSLYHVCLSPLVNNPCPGDSGGPTFDANKVQVGIVSYGDGRWS